MAELDEIWVNLLDQASSRAVETGRADLAEYLRLKLANDTIRRTGVDWLFQTLIDEALEASRNYPMIKVDRVSPHSFKVGTSNMVGSLVQVQQGVRCMALEAGWVRTPADGVMRNGSLAHARFRHFGMSREDEEVRLVATETLPMWVTMAGTEVHAKDIRRHLQIFLK